MLLTTLKSLSETDQTRCEAYIAANESYRATAYDDATGLRVKAPRGNLTIGHGINLDAGMSVDESMALLTNRLCIAEDDILNSSVLRFYTSLSTVRKVVMLDLTYNLGLASLLGFKNFLYCMSTQSYDNAAADLQDSAYFNQVHDRAIRNQLMIKTNAWTSS